MDHLVALCLQHGLTDLLCMSDDGMYSEPCGTSRVNVDMVDRRQTPVGLRVILSF